MDYERYIELYRQGKFQEAVEYKATQVPTRLVKYYSLNDNETVNKSKLQYLKEQRIFLSASSLCNSSSESKNTMYSPFALSNPILATCTKSSIS